jgi:predicted dehydrogenase
LTESTINLGLLGSGFILDGFHLPVLKQLGQSVNLAAVAGRDQAKAQEFRKRWGIGRAYSGENGIEKLCSDPEVDVVLVALPNYLHLKAIESAAENHKHLICEKPLARNAKEARMALSAVQRYGVLDCYAENQIFIPQVAKASKMIRDGALGKLTCVRSREAHSGPHSKWFYDPERAGGGVLLDMGCHSVEVARKLIGTKPLAVDAWCATLLHEIKSEDNSFVLVKYEGECLSQCENSWTTKGGLDIRLEVYGTDGSIFIDITRETGMRSFTTGSGKGVGYVVEKADVTSGWTYPMTSEAYTYGYYDELSSFLHNIRVGERSTETFHDGYIVNTIIDEAYKSSRNLEKWVNLDLG